MLSLKKIALGTVTVATLLASQTALAAKAVEAYFHAFNGSLDYRSFGYSGPDGTWIPLAGQKIVGARAEVQFTPDQEADLASFRMAMVVPVSGAQSQYFLVDGNSLIPMGRGKYYAELTSAMYNGVVVDGRFSVETYTLGTDGNPYSLHGKLGSKSGFRFIVTAP